MTSPTRTNWIANPSAEVDTSRTSAFGTTLTRTTAEGYVGTAAFEIVAPGSTGFEGCGIESPRSLGHTGAAQAVAGRVALKGSGTVNVSVRLRYTDATLAEGARTLVTLTGAWTPVVASSAVTDPAKTVNYYEVIVRTNTTQAITFYVDAAMVEFGTEPGDYFDGDSPNAEWTGTPHASTSVLTIPDTVVPTRQFGASALDSPTFTAAAPVPTAFEAGVPS